MDKRVGGREKENQIESEIYIMVEQSSPSEHINHPFFFVIIMIYLLNAHNAHGIISSLFIKC